MSRFVAVATMVVIFGTAAGRGSGVKVPPANLFTAAAPVP